MRTCNTCLHCDSVGMKCHPGVEGFAETYLLEEDEMREQNGCEFYDESIDHTEIIKFINDLKDELDSVQSVCITLSDLNYRLKQLTENVNVGNVKEYTDVLSRLKTFNGLVEEYKKTILSKLDRMEGSKHE